VKRIFPIPLYAFCKTVYRHGGLSGRGLLHAMPWIIKTTVTESLRWIEHIKYNQKIESHKIEKDPVFILGYYRSGTTYLQEMFMQDDRLGFTSIYQTIFPEIMLAFEKSMTPVLEKITKAFKTQNYFHRTPFTWYAAGEEDVALISLLYTNAVQWGILFPYKAIDIFIKFALFENISDSELKKWKDNYIYLLKKISLANKSKQLVLKSPPNTARIKQLLLLFPNARFVYISRNPVHVYASAKYLWEMIIKKYVLGKYSAADIQQIILKTYSMCVNRYMEDKLLIAPERLIEISYEKFIREPVNTMKQIYTQLKLEYFGHCETAMKNYVHQQRNYKPLEHTLDEQELNMAQHQLISYIKNWKEIKEYQMGKIIS
jgi:hypothetical protein